MMRFEKELQQKEMRHEMKHRLSQMQKNNSAQQLQPQQSVSNLLKQQQKPQINVVELPGSAQNLNRPLVPTPSPLTPNSTEELLPMVDETQEEVKKRIYVFLAFTDFSRISFQFTSLFSSRPSASYNGPCSPFDGL